MRQSTRIAVPWLLAAVGTMALAAAKSPHKAPPAPVRLATIMVKGKKTRVFEAANGRTLYYFTKNKPTKLACTGSCERLWPPYKVKALPKLRGVKGHFSLFKGQLEYQGHELYRYSGDKGPGQSHGEGLFHAWYVATPTLRAAVGVKSGGGSSGGW